MNIVELMKNRKKINFSAFLSSKTAHLSLKYRRLDLILLESLPDE